MSNSLIFTWLLTKTLPMPFLAKVSSNRVCSNVHPQDIMPGGAALGPYNGGVRLASCHAHIRSPDLLDAQSLFMRISVYG